VKPEASWRRRAGGAALALLVQFSFLLLVLVTPPHHVWPEIEKETLLLVPPPPYSPPVMIAPLAPPSGIAGFGRSLFGCAPERYANLTPDERAHCPKPGEGMAVNQPPDLLNPPKSHAKDEALWQEQYAEDHYVPPICPPSDGPPIGFCVLHHAIDENRRRQEAWQKITEDKTARLQEPKRPLPKIGVRRD
jgi:hypothetical protein